MDYIPPPTVVTFTSTQAVDCKGIPIIDDLIVEGAESFRVDLGSNDIQVLTDEGINSALVVIDDNDVQLSKLVNSTYDKNYFMTTQSLMLLGVLIFAFTQAAYFVSEGVGSASVCVALVSGTSTVAANIPIDLSTLPDTADSKL